MTHKKKNILIISPEAWGPNFVSKHHYANFLSIEHNVYFLNPPNKFNFFKSAVKTKVLSDNLRLITYSNVIPKLNKSPRFLRQVMFKYLIKKVKNQVENSELDIVWSFDPRRFQNQQDWHANHSIYHSVDLHPNAVIDESRICLNSDIVIGLSDIICENLRKFNDMVYKVTHGCHIDFTNYIRESLTLPGENKVKAIYVGNIHKHIDFQLLFKLASENEVDFIIVGPTTNNNLSNDTISNNELNQLNKLTNLHFIGSVESHSIMNYLLAADINLVLFKEEHALTHHAPHKMLAYFASGNITLANRIDEYRNFSMPLIEQCDQDMILDCFKRIVANLDTVNSEENQKLRRDFSQKNLYSQKITEIFQLLT